MCVCSNHTGNWDAYVASLRALSPKFAAYRKYNYCPAVLQHLYDIATAPEAVLDVMKRTLTRYGKGRDEGEGSDEYHESASSLIHKRFPPTKFTKEGYASHCHHLNHLQSPLEWYREWLGLEPYKAKSITDKELMEKHQHIQRRITSLAADQVSGGVYDHKKRKQAGHSNSLLNQGQIASREQHKWAQTERIVGLEFTVNMLRACYNGAQLQDALMKWTKQDLKKRKQSAGKYPKPCLLGDLLLKKQLKKRADLDRLMNQLNSFLVYLAGIRQEGDAPRPPVTSIMPYVWVNGDGQNVVLCTDKASFLDLMVKKFGSEAKAKEIKRGEGCDESTSRYFIDGIRHFQTGAKKDQTVQQHLDAFFNKVLAPMNKLGDKGHLVVVIDSQRMDDNPLKDVCKDARDHASSVQSAADENSALRLDDTWRQENVTVRWMKRKLTKTLIEYAQSPDNPIQKKLKNDQKVVIAIGDGETYPVVITRTSVTSDSEEEYPRFEQPEGEYSMIYLAKHCYDEHKDVPRLNPKFYFESGDTDALLLLLSLSLMPFLSNCTLYLHPGKKFVISELRDAIFKGLTLPKVQGGILELPFPANKKEDMLAFVLAWFVMGGNDYMPKTRGLSRKDFMESFAEHTKLIMGREDGFTVAAAEGSQDVPVRLNEWVVSRWFAVTFFRKYKQELGYTHGDTKTQRYHDSPEGSFESFLYSQGGGDVDKNRERSQTGLWVERMQLEGDHIPHILQRPPGRRDLELHVKRTEHVTQHFLSAHLRKPQHSQDMADAGFQRYGNGKWGIQLATDGEGLQRWYEFEMERSIKCGCKKGIVGERCKRRCKCRKNRKACTKRCECSKKGGCSNRTPTEEEEVKAREEVSRVPGQVADLDLHQLPEELEEADSDGEGSDVRESGDDDEEEDCGPAVLERYQDIEEEEFLTMRE